MLPPINTGQAALTTSTMATVWVAIAQKARHLLPRTARAKVAPSSKTKTAEMRADIGLNFNARAFRVVRQARG